MTNEIVEQCVIRAVGRAYSDWAVEHPSLARVIDRIAVTQRVSESLRETPEFQSAVDAFGSARSELDLLNRLTELAAPLWGPPRACSPGSEAWSLLLYA